MTLPKIEFIKQQGGLARIATGEDHISGLIAYCGTLPSAWGANRIRQIFGIAEAVQYGIVGDWSDETKAGGGNVEIKAPGSAGDTHTITMDGTTLGAYTTITGDAIADVASALRLAINNSTSIHGYSAAGSAGDIALAAPAGLGDTINGGSHLTYTSSGTGTATVTQFSNGVTSVLKPIHYHIHEFFRINPDGELWVYLAEDPSPSWSDFAEVETLKDASSGKIRQYLLFAAKEVDLDANAVQEAQSIAAKIESQYSPAIIILSADISATVDLTTLPDLRALACPKVCVIIGQGGINSTGAAIANIVGYSVTMGGALLGAVSKAKVHENIGWIEKFDIAGNELVSPAIANGTLITAISIGAITSLHNKGYIFGMKEAGISGTFFNDSNTSVAATSDYAYIENNRVIDKAIRLIRAALVTKLKAPVYVDPNTGMLELGVVRYYEELGNTAITQMIRDGELSGGQTLIDPKQNILSTSNMNVTVELVPVGVNRIITVSIGFTLKLS